INRFTSIGIFLSGSQDVIQTCFIGTSPDGTMALANGAGVDIEASNNTIGGTAAGTGNTISGNTGYGVRIYGSMTTGNVIVGNHIGTNAAGTGALANGADGVDVVFGANNNTIGGTVAGSGNVISGNTGYGIRINGSDTTANLVEGNVIGTNAAGTG